jgi:hypothetical protein
MVDLVEEQKVDPVRLDEILQIDAQPGIHLQRRGRRRAEENGKIDIRSCVDSRSGSSRESSFTKLLLRAEKIAQGYAVVSADIDKSFHEMNYR